MSSRKIVINEPKKEIKEFYKNFSIFDLEIELIRYHIQIKNKIEEYNKILDLYESLNGTKNLKLYPFNHQDLYFNKNILM